jgi:uncharacterized protein (TIGR02996 family)
MSQKRIFEHVDGATTKFWEVWRDDATIYTYFGKVGFGGQTTLREEGTSEAADAAIQKLVHSFVARGYVEDGTPPAAVNNRIDAGELEGHLAALGDDASYGVFADWLQGQGNPWGELITLQLAARGANAKKRAELEKATAALLEARGPAIIGPAASHERSHFEWHNGFLRTATIGTTADPVAITSALETLLAQPVARMIEGLVINAIPTSFATTRDSEASVDNVVDPWGDLEAIAKLVPARVTHVGFGGAPVTAASAYVQMPSYSTISKAFPKLRRLELTGYAASERGTIDLPELVELEVRFADAQFNDLPAITDSNLGKLERITVWLGGSANCVLDSVYDFHETGGYPESYDGNDLAALEVYDVACNLATDSITEFLNALQPNVKHVGLRSAAISEPLVDAILASERIASLESLDLSGGVLDDAAAKALIAAKKSLAHLKLLDVERNRIGAATAKKLAAALPNARTGNQRKEAQPELFLRYVSTME